MFLSLSQKREILNSFKELTEQVDNNGRYSYKLEDSADKRKVIAREFTHTGNGYVYGMNLPDYSKLTDARGWVNVKDFSATQLKDIVSKQIEYLKDSPSLNDLPQPFKQKDEDQHASKPQTLKHRIIRNLIQYEQNVLAKKEFWDSKCSGFNSGIYIYQLENATIPYPFNFNEVFYIGKGINLSERLRWHFTIDNRKKFVDDEQCLEWFYQNYYLSKKHLFNIHIVSLPQSEIDTVELLVIGMFALRHGSVPICNSNVSRSKFKEVYYHSSDTEKEFIKKILDLVS